MYMSVPPVVCQMMLYTTSKLARRPYPSRIVTPIQPLFCINHLAIALYIRDRVQVNLCLPTKPWGWVQVRLLYHQIPLLHFMEQFVISPANWRTGPLWALVVKKRQVAFGKTHRRCRKLKPSRIQVIRWRGSGVGSALFSPHLPCDFMLTTVSPQYLDNSNDHVASSLVLLISFQTSGKN